MAKVEEEEGVQSETATAEESSSGFLDVLTPIRRSNSTKGADLSAGGRSPVLLRSNSVKCGPGGPTGFDPEDPSALPPPRSPRPKPKSLTGGFPQSRTGSKKVYYML